LLKSINGERYNYVYLPGIFIDPAITVTDDLDAACDCDVMILCVPAQALRTICIALSDRLPPPLPLVLASTGIERGSMLLMSELVSSILMENPIAVLSGPNFADEAAKGLPTATAIACADAVLGERLMYAVGGKMFRPYLTDDIIGTQIGGAAKNVIAIACGIVEGAKLGENAKAALITRGLAEISRLCRAKGGKPQTLMGLAGIGDLMLTCGSATSRNMSLGLNLGKGMPIKDALNNARFGVIEGVATAESIIQLAHNLGVEMPISQAVYNILHREQNVEDTIEQMLERPFSAESM